LGEGKRKKPEPGAMLLKKIKIKKKKKKGGLRSPKLPLGGNWGHKQGKKKNSRAARPLTRKKKNFSFRGLRQIERGNRKKKKKDRPIAAAGAGKRRRKKTDWKKRGGGKGLGRHSGKLTKKEKKKSPRGKTVHGRILIAAGKSQGR